MAGRRRLSWIVVLASSFLLSGCAFFKADRIHYQWAEGADTPCVACTPVVDGDTFVGIALSGGGSRASMFGAAAMEVLAEAGIMQQATHISSVSGGGFAASYYTLHRPAPCTVTQLDAPCESEDYAAFKQTMRNDYLFDMTAKQFTHPSRLTSPTRRLLSLRDVLKTEITGGATFGNLPPSPILLINTARYDDGRRFVFSNLPIPDEPSTIRPYTERTLQTASFSLPGCTRAVPQDFSVALAVAISAAFPPLLGPAGLEMPDTCQGENNTFWHLGDGGILENTGVETLEDYALNSRNGGAHLPDVFIFSIDAGANTRTETMMQTQSLNLWTTNPGRVVDIVGKRANAYRAVLAKQMAAETGATFHHIKMRYTDAQLTTWPDSCDEQNHDPAAILAKLETVPTNLRISECNADLIEASARDVVPRALAAHRAQLAAAGFTWRGAVEPEPSS